MPKAKVTKEEDVDIARMYLEGMTAVQVGESYGVYKQVILNSLKRSGVSRRTEWKRASGEKNGKWKGGIRMVKGYRHLYIPEHRLARADGWVAEHRLLKETEILDDQQIVHHKDGNRLNNTIDNLEVLANNGVHRALHVVDDKRDKKGRFKK